MEGIVPRVILQFEDQVLKEYPLGTKTTIGRLPDNTVVIDNPAVSGHHACIVRNGDAYTVEDLGSTNGTFVNEKCVSRATLRNSDVVLVGKHTLVFDANGGDEPIAVNADKPSVPNIEGTVFLDTRQHRALLAKLGIDGDANKTAAGTGTDALPATRVGVLRVIDGAADRPEFQLEAQTSLIGKAEASLIRLKGWFKPSVAIAISRDGHNYVATLLRGNTLINHQQKSGRHHLKEGDLLEVGGLMLEFRLKG